MKEPGRGAQGGYTNNKKKIEFQVNNELQK